MSTRSFVGVMQGNWCRAIYVHFDGYLEGVGAELQEYKTQSDIEVLIAPGDRSTLHGGFYSDREDESDIDHLPTDFDTFEEFFEACEGSWGEWYYIWKDGVWYCGNTYEGSKLYKTLTPYAEAVEIYEAEVEAEDA